MFTGIVNEIGKLKERKNSLFIFSVSLAFGKKIHKSDSVAVNGVCLTVIKLSKNTFSAEIMPETEQKTSLSSLKLGDEVNLELPTTPSSFLSGHIVQGHVDEIGVLVGLTDEGNSKILKIKVSKNSLPYLVEKGSVCANGISLTVVKVGINFFTVKIIPHTWQNTMLKNIKVRDLVNVETDIMARYILKFYKKI